MSSAATQSPAATVVAEDVRAVCSNVGEDMLRLCGSTVLVTGGAGFLGYTLVHALAHWNRTRGPDRARIIVLDNFSRGLPGWLSELAAKGEITLLRHDIRDPLPADLPKCHWIIHGASIASPIYYRKDPIGTMDANVNGLRALLNLALAQRDTADPVRGFLFFSSSEIYGDPDPANIPTAEDYRGFVSCTGPRACYDEAKRYGETLCVNFARQYGIPTRSARPFNNYGPGLKISDGRLIPDFARDIFAGRDIVMLSDGRPTRTFCYASDAITGYLKVLLRGRDGEAYNIGTERPEISVYDLGMKLVELGRELFGYSGSIVRQQSTDAHYLVDNPNRRCPVIDKARRELGYEPRVSLDEGLRRSLIWYNENRSAEDR